MDKLIIRAYNVLFGDAYLIKIPDRSPCGNIETKHILIDFGNAATKAGGNNKVFEPVIKDIIKELKGKPLDLYIMTHEHMDHVQGMLYSQKKHFSDLKDLLDTQFAWLTASSKTDYYDTHPEAKKAFDLYQEAYNKIAQYTEAVGLDNFSDLFQIILANNDTRRTRDCVHLLKNLAPANQTFYVHREFPLEKGIHHNFNEINFEIWGPEEDTSIYYRALPKMNLGLNGDGQVGVPPSLIEHIPPAGVDAGTFYKMLDNRKRFSENLLTIDKARNNTSIVLNIEWRDWRLLFAGDAEERSWRIMNREGVIKSVDFLKVSHHGSHNGTPEDEIFDKVFPPIKPTAKKRTAVVSTFENQYNKVPDQNTLNIIEKRCEEFSVLYKELDAGSYRDFEFEG